MFINFTHLNATCPKDNLPLLKIDLLVDGAAGYKLLSFIYAYNGNNQILMAKEDKEKTTFVTYRVYCYRVMPLGWKMLEQPIND